MNKRTRASLIGLTFILFGGAWLRGADGPGAEAKVVMPDSVCGNGVAESGEQCEDGNLVMGDGCSAACMVEAWTGRWCADGLDNDGDGRADAADPGCHADWDADNDASYDAARGEYGIVLLSESAEGIEGNHPSAGATALSADGRFIAFASSADNLVADDGNGEEDVFRRDRLTGEIVWVSAGAENGGSTAPSISADGGRIAFESEADNLVAGDTNGASDIFLRDLDTGQTKRISVSSSGAQSDGSSYFPSLSPDGRFVKFTSYASNLTPGDDGFHSLFLYDSASGTLAGVDAEWEPWSSEYANYAKLSADGRFVAFESSDEGLAAGDNNGTYDVFVRDGMTGGIELVSRAADGTAGWGASFAPAISADGRFVVFESEAYNLVEDDDNNYSDIFLYDREAGRSIRISVSANGSEAADSSGLPAISADGRYISFYSWAWNLVPEDRNGTEDVFLVKNPLQTALGTAPAVPTELSQRGADGGEIGVGRIANEGAEAADKVRLSARVESMDGGPVRLEVEVVELDEAGNWRERETLRSVEVAGGARAMIEYAPRGGLYAWRARSVDAAGRASGWVEFGGNGSGEMDFISSNFSFVFLTDVHLGSNETFLATKLTGPWHETQSYSRFTDTLYEIERLTPRPDFILIGGDNVEYNDPRWLQDFKSLTDDYRARTGIGVYFVPGNHDRYDSESTAWSWEDWNLSGGDDKLRNYSSAIGKPDWMASLFAGDGAIMDAVESAPGGLNRYNFSFNHKGFQFIGLDSGEDTGRWDNKPEGSGLSDGVVDRFENLIATAPSMPRVVFMHHPVYSKAADIYGEKNSDGISAEDEAIVNNWSRFIGDCKDGNVQLVLSGHTHTSVVFDVLDQETELVAWRANMGYPLFLQTQSAGKGDDHGYRLVRVRNGRALPEEPRTSVRSAEKVIADLDGGTGLDFSVFDGNGIKLTAGAGSDTSSFLASASGRLISYDNLNGSRLEIKNGEPLDTSFDLRLERRGEGIELAEEHRAVFGYRVENPQLCNFSQLLCPEFMLLRKGEGHVDLSLKDIGIKAGSTDSFSVDWDNLQSGAGTSGLTLGFDGNRDTSFGALLKSFIADLDSPGELRVIDSEGKVTGMVGGEMVEEIPYSAYDPETEAVYVFGDASAEVGKGLKTQVIGQFEAGYDLSLTLQDGGQTVSEFVADDIPTSGDMSHQFSVDWEALARGGEGVTMQFDENDDGVFDAGEKVIVSDSSLSFPKVELSAERYAGEEGMAVSFDGSGSSSADGGIISFEWDFDGDGTFDEETPGGIAAHVYGDDFEGRAIVRVTDSRGLAGVGRAEVSIVNAPPSASITKFGLAETSDRFILEGKVSDPGRLDTLAASIDWGDGQTENVFPDADGRINTSHRYDRIQSFVVELVVTDDDGGEVSASAILSSPRQMKTEVLAEIEALGADDRKLKRELDRAIENLEEALRDKYWQDDFHLKEKNLLKDFVLEQKVITRLEKITKDKKADALVRQEIQEALDRLKASDEYILHVVEYEMNHWTRSMEESLIERIKKLWTIRSF